MVIIQETAKSHRSTRSEKRGRDTPEEEDPKKQKKTSQSTPVIRRMLERTLDGASWTVSERRRKDEMSTRERE